MATKWTDGQRHVLNDDDAEMWARCNPKAFKCGICGRKFSVGDGYRWIYCNGPSERLTGNFFACDNCDGPDVKMARLELWDQFKRLDALF